MRQKINAKLFVWETLNVLRWRMRNETLCRTLCHHSAASSCSSPSSPVVVTLFYFSTWPETHHGHKAIRNSGGEKEKSLKNSQYHFNTEILSLLPKL